MTLVDFQERLIWNKLEMGKNLLELTTFEAISLWWNIDHLFYHFLLSTLESNGKVPSVTRRNVLTVRLFGTRIGLLFFLILDILLFLFGKLIILIAKISKNEKKLDYRKKPIFLIISYDAAWVATPSYLSGLVRKSDHLKDSVMETLQHKVDFLGTSSFRYRKASFKIAVERSLFWIHSYNLLNVYWSPKSWLKQVQAFNFFKKQLKIIKNDSKFRKQCQLKNNDFSDIIFREFDYYFHFLLPLCVSWVETFSSLIDKIKPSLVLISNETGHSEKSLIIASKKRKIPVLAMQHGVIDPINRGYIFTEKDISKNGSIHSPYNPIADRTAVFGTKYKNFIDKHSYYPEGSVVVTGNPKFDKLFQMVNKFKNRGDIRRWLNIPEEKPILLWTTQTHWLSAEENRMNVDAVYSALVEIKDAITLIVKLHPNEDQTAPFYKEDSRIKPVFLGKEVDILQLVYISDILITKHSMTATEAVALNKPVIILNLSGNPDIIDCVDEGVAVGVYKKEDLNQEILALLEDDSIIAKNRSRYVDAEYYLIDGKSSERMARLMETMINKKES
ncbi:MAG: CDP-glycerol glycerophosphotransferase family protein [Candidatus Hodarchaeales archaeon]|jgi:UDP-N-acetylglucosamine 2-epimerase